MVKLLKIYNLQRGVIRWKWVITFDLKLTVLFLIWFSSLQFIYFFGNLSAKNWLERLSLR